MNRPLAVSFLTLALCAAANAAQVAATAKPPVAPAPKSGYRAEVLADLDELQKKYVDLAGAVPAEKYRWRPAAGVRSVSEVYMHVAGSNYLLPTFLGIKPPAVNGDLEKTVTEKAKAVAELKKSFEHLRGVILGMSDADLDKGVKMFGQPMSERQVVTRIITHLHEHLGQSIAYARMNGVVPPWSRNEG